MVLLVLEKINTLIMHMFGSEVVEYIFCESNPAEKRELKLGFYGKYFLILKESEGKTLKEILEEKPTMKEGILSKLEGVCFKLIDKGLARHNIVQSILWDYFQVASPAK